jgi:hypothetical protein
MNFIQKLKRLFASEPASDEDAKSRQRRSDPPFGGLRDKDFAGLPPERAAELAGHAPERVDT